MVAKCALRFFYAMTLGRKEAIENVISAREPIKQPLVLSAEEVARFLEAVPALRDRVALVTAYAAGLRVGEVSRLKPSAIDSKRMLILTAARPRPGSSTGATVSSTAIIVPRSASITRWGGEPLTLVGT
jgi:integrase